MTTGDSQARDPWAQRKFQGSDRVNQVPGPRLLWPGVLLGFPIPGLSLGAARDQAGLVRWGGRPPPAPSPTSSWT